MYRFLAGCSSSSLRHTSSGSSRLPSSVVGPILPRSSSIASSSSSSCPSGGGCSATRGGGALRDASWGLHINSGDGLFGGSLSASQHMRVQTRNTTILCVRKNTKVVMVGDGLVTQGGYKVKPNALKVRTLGKDKNLVMVGFAGVTADCLALIERLEMKLEEYPGQLVRASVELAKMWRLDKMMRQLNSTVIVANADATLELTGTGDCFEPHDGVLGIGSGGPFATAAARALMEAEVPLDAKEIAVRACTIASTMDTASNDRFVIEEIDAEKLNPNAESAENETKLKSKLSSAA